MGRFRDAVTGLFTTRQHAEDNPATTVRETRRGRIVVNGRTPSHYCPQCGALWLRDAAGWLIVSSARSECCRVKSHLAELP